MSPLARVTVVVVLASACGGGWCEEAPFGLPLGAQEISEDLGFSAEPEAGGTVPGEGEWDFDARISDRAIAWQKDDGHDWEIWVATGRSKPEQLTDNESQDVCADTDGDFVTWWGNEGDDWDVYVDGPMGVVRLGNHPGSDEYPRVSDKRVAWFGWDGSDYEIYVWDSRTNQTTQITDNEVDDGGVTIEGTEIAWMCFNGQDAEIMWMDLATGASRQLTDNDLDDRLPSIGDGIIAWECGDGLGSEIMVMHEDGRVENITSNHVGDWYPEVSGKRVIWERHDAGFDLMVWDGGDEFPCPVRITNSVQAELNPRISGHWVVWSQRDVKVGVADSHDQALRQRFTRPEPIGTVECDVYLLGDLRPALAVGKLAEMIRLACEEDVLTGDLALTLRTEADDAMAALQLPGGDAAATCRQHLETVLGFARGLSARAGTNEGIGGKVVALALDALGAVGENAP